MEPPVRFCKHIHAARERFTDDVIQRMLANARAG